MLLRRGIVIALGGLVVSDDSKGEGTLVNLADDLLKTFGAWSRMKMDGTETGFKRAGPVVNPVEDHKRVTY